MKHFRHLPTIIWVAAGLVCSTGAVTRPAVAQNIIDQFPTLKSRNVDDYVDEGILDDLKSQEFFAEMQRKYGTR